MPRSAKSSAAGGPKGVVLVGTNLGNPYGVEVTNTLTGSVGDDSITGGRAGGPGVLTNDMDGRAGDDVITGGGSAIGLVINNASGGQGHDTLTGGTSEFLGSGVNTLTGGSGNDYIVGGENTYRGLTQNYLYGDAGRDTIIGGSTFAAVNNYIDAGSGDDVIIGGSGHGIRVTVINVMLGGSGKDTITAGHHFADQANVRTATNELSGGDDADVFIFKSMGHVFGFHSSTIKDFNSADGDVIDLADYKFGSFENLLSRATNQGGGTRLQLDDYSTLFLSNTTVSSLTASDILI